MRKRMVLVIAGAMLASLTTVTGAAVTSAPAAVGSTSQAAPAAAPAQALARRWRPTPGPKFNVPRSRPETQFRIERQVIGAIRHAPRGSVIQMSMFSFDRFPVTDALIAARNRGVRVQVLINNHEMTPAQRKLRKRLGSRRLKSNFAYQCRHGCRSRGGILHSKFVLFSQTGSVRNTVMLGSVNMKMNGAKNQYNDLLTMNGASRLYSNLQSYFNQMRRDRPARPGYWRYNIGSNMSVRASPWAGKRSNDPQMEMLAPIRCKGAATPNGRTKVYVNMHAWDGERGQYIAGRIQQLWSQGCDVRVQFGYGGRGVRRVLSRPGGGRGRMPMRSNGMDTNDDGEIDLYSHQKLIIINGWYGNTKNRKVVVTGSTNFQGNRAVISGDELVFRLYSPQVYYGYLNNFNWMWNKRTRPGSYVTRKTVLGKPSVEIDPENLSWPKDAWKQG